MNKKALYILFALIHLAMFLFMLSACDGCCDDCNCCVEGSPVATKTTSVSFCTTNGCPNGNFKSTNNPDGAGCSAACNNKYLNQNNGLKGCTNPQAVNWNRDATIDDNSCIVKGCMEKCADNFDGDATQADNSTCKYSPQCTDPAANKAVPANCYSKVTSDRSKCNFNKDPDPTNPDVKPITITSADVCVTQSSAKDLPVGAEVTFRATYTYEGSKNIYLKMIRGTADCLNCDTPKKLSTGKDLQTYSQFVIETSNDLGRSFLVQISTRNPISGSQTAEQTAEKVVIASTNTPACQSMVEGKYKPLGASTAPAKPTIAKVTLASSILTVTVKHDVREPSLISSNTLNNNEKVPDYYVVAYDDYKNRSLYKSGDAVDMDAWYKAIVEGGKGTVKVFRPAKKSPEEESFASPADNQKTYAIFVKAINIVWPYEAEPPSIVPKVSAAEGSPMAQTVYPTATSAVSIASKDRMLKATVTIPASANNASFTLKSATQDMGTYDNLLGTSGSQTYHIYAGEDEIFSDAENADPAADAYSDQKVTIVRDPANDRKFYLYAVFNALVPVTLNVSMDGVPGPETTHSLVVDNTYDFANWIDFADEVISTPKPPVVVTIALKKSSAASPSLRHPGLAARSLIQAYGYPFRLEISWALGFYDGVNQGFKSDGEGVAGLAVFCKDFRTNASNLAHIIRQEAGNFTFEKFKTAYEGVIGNLHDALHSEADKNVPFPGFGTKWQVQFYMYGYVTGYLLEQAYVGMAVAKGFGFLGRGLAYGINLSRSAIVLEGISPLVKWRTAVVFYASKPLQAAAEIAKDQLASIHEMVEKLMGKSVAGSSDTYAKRLSEFADQGEKTLELGNASDFKWIPKAVTTEERLVELGEILADEGSSKLTESGAQGFLRMYPIMVDAEEVESGFLGKFLDGFRGADNKINREALNQSFEDFNKVPLVNKAVNVGAAITKADLDEVVAAAKSWQGKGSYPLVDDWVGQPLTKGMKVYIGLPGISGFIITEEAMAAAGNDLDKLYKGLQIKPHKKEGMRKIFIHLEVTEDIPAAFSKALKNDEWGAGGAKPILRQ